MWKRYSSLFVLSISVTVAAITYAEQEGKIERHKNQSKALIKEYSKSLKSKLKTTLLTEGPVAAVDVCAEWAPKIASEMSRANGLSIRRVSEKARNPQDMPDEWETKILNNFKEKHQKGVKFAHMDHGEMVTEAGKTYWRYMKPIVFKAQCAMCHGASNQIAPEVKSILSKRYPHDPATGYSPGDLRGAFSVKQLIESK